MVLGFEPVRATETNSKIYCWWASLVRDVLEENASRAKELAQEVYNRIPDKIGAKADHGVCLCFFISWGRFLVSWDVCCFKVDCATFVRWLSGMFTQWLSKRYGMNWWISICFVGELQRVWALSWKQRGHKGLEYVEAQKNFQIQDLWVEQSFSS